MSSSALAVSISITPIAAVTPRNRCADYGRAYTKSNPLSVVPMPASTIVATMTATAVPMRAVSFSYWNKRRK